MVTGRRKSAFFCASLIYFVSSCPVGQPSSGLPRPRRSPDWGAHGLSDWSPQRLPGWPPQPSPAWPPQRSPGWPPQRSPDWAPPPPPPQRSPGWPHVTTPERSPGWPHVTTPERSPGWPHVATPERSHNPFYPARAHQTAIKLLHLDEGDVCRRGHGLYADYVCTAAADCAAPLAKSVRDENYLDVCTFSDSRLIVCCPSDAGDLFEGGGRRPAVTVGNRPEGGGRRPAVAVGDRPVGGGRRPPDFLPTTAVAEVPAEVPAEVEGDASLDDRPEDSAANAGRPPDFLLTTTPAEVEADASVDDRPKDNAGQPPDFLLTTTPAEVPADTSVDDRPDETATAAAAAAATTSGSPDVQATTSDGADPPLDTRVGNGASSTGVAVEKCRQYSKLKFPKENFFFIAVVGGREALSQEFPHMAVLGYGETTERDEDWKCGGSLISERWILTAAHCRTDKAGALARWVRVGDLMIGPTVDTARPKDTKIVEHVLHPDYKPSERYNDIGLFRMESDVEFSAFVRPICLNTDPKLNPAVQIATGWGRTSTAESTSDVLLKVALTIFPATRCNDTYFSNNPTELRFGVLDDSMICAGSNRDDEDTCSGDSGGPLQTENAANPGTYTQFGITSFGPAFCGVKETPGVYTKVSKYVPWIERIVWPTG